MNESTLNNIFSLIGTLVGTLSGILISNRLVTWRLEQLEKRVEQHNSVVERTVALERDVKTAFTQIGDQKEICRRLHQR